MYLRVPERLTPGSAAHIGPCPVRIARIRTVGVRFALGFRIAIVELPVNQANVRTLRGRGVEDGSRLVPSSDAAAKGRGCLNSAFPRQYAVLIVGCVICCVPCSDAVCVGRDATPVQLPGRPERNDDILRTAVWTTDGHSDRCLLYTSPSPRD